ncbi:hypothetical protein E8L90_05365 [Brevibacillus antibioticus]|uniref:GNAT family N-acetyltransferase n=1 Tax=Brevibacillus antibioticus TaxID=2570228 RepID=A0A4U2Y5D7_9BACL|nr:hypothetical protein [Brevibacillus antibioticus]TKI54922.1 hypothetical protein E8L90_05365 [Brevibacillus antibioticus]
MKLMQSRNVFHDEEIQEVLLQHKEAFGFSDIVDVNAMKREYEFYVALNCENELAGLGWIDTFYNEDGEVEAEVSLCVYKDESNKGTGTFILLEMEKLIVNSNVNIINSMIKRSNPNYDFVVEWFLKQGYQLILEEVGADTWLQKRI